jgi:glyoxalase family protein
MPFQTPGLHHVTATTDRDQDDLDFFAFALGLPLVKQTGNFDNPAVYHFYYGDAAGTPGTLMTTFPYGTQGTRRGLPGSGVCSRVVFSAPAGAQAFWTQRLSERKVAFQVGEALGMGALLTTDPSGLPLAIAFADDERTPAPGLASEGALRGLMGVQLTVRDAAPVARFLEETMGLTTSRDGRRTLAQMDDGGPGRLVELLEDADAPPSVNGIGTVHHVAFRARTPDDQDALRETLLAMGIRVTEHKDRKYFRSIYFRDGDRTGGVLFEIATDAPGFAVDEDPNHLGERLRLPPGLDDEEAVAAGLPEIRVPTP